MPAYRAYFLDKDDHITGTETIEVGSLRAGIDIALGMLKGLPDNHSLELWEGEKRRCSLPFGAYGRRAQRAAASRRPEPTIVGRTLEPTEMAAISLRLAAAREAMMS
jgi:hypothetical protein